MSTNPSYSEVSCTRPVGRPTGDMHYWISVAGVYLSSCAIVFLAIMIWHTVDAKQARDREFEFQQRKFNVELVAAIGNLAEKTGILTSADFCPVRFRLRFQNGEIPVQRVNARLTKLTPNADEQSDWISTSSGVIDFGLRSPGKYRLQMATVDEMSLEHEFQVLPGVPVDRVIFCPNSPQASESPVKVKVVVNWPAELAADDLIALIEIRPGQFEAGDWCWTTATDWPLYAIAATSVDHDSAVEVIRDLQFAGDLAGEWQPDLYSVGAVPLPYRYCQIGAITFVHRSRDSPSRKQFQVLGTVVYGTSESVKLAAGHCRHASGAPPRYEADPSFRYQWTVEIPQDCANELLQRIQEVTHSLDGTT